MNNNDTAMVNGNGSANCLITEAGVYRRDFIYDENTDSESEVIRYVKKQQVRIDNNRIPANQSQMSTDNIAWIVPIASVGAAIYLAISEGPNIISRIRDKVKKKVE